MEIHNIEEFMILINSGTIENITIDVTTELLTIVENDIITEMMYFKNCILNFHQITFYDISKPNLSISFEHCELNGDLEFQISELRGISFVDTIKFTNISLLGSYERKCKLRYFTFTSGMSIYPQYILSGKLFIMNYIFTDQINMQGIQLHQGSFSFFNSHILKECRTIFTNAVFSLPAILGNNFESKVDFKGTNFINSGTDFNNPEHRKDQYNGFIRDNTFQDVDFSGAQFYNASKIFSCDFRGRTYFENIGYNENTFLIFEECEFGGTSYFDAANINILYFIKCNFDKRVSFTNAKFNKVFFNNVKFDKPAYFDNISIECLKNDSFLESKLEEFDSWKITIRTIKHELLKINSRFDYNKFRNYEVAAYYQELNWKWKGDFKDKTILWATKHVTGFDHSWRKALRFVLLSAFIFFNLFFISENYELSISLSGIPQYITGYFRFLLVTDFYNPLSDGRYYIGNNGWNHIASWFIFILGKIFIAFGIYEMIQAFRKFKA